MDIDKLIQLGIDGKLDEIEEERERLFQEFIASIDPNDEGRLRKANGIHFKMKNIRHTVNNRSKVLAMNKSFDIMMESFLELNEELKKI